MRLIDADALLEGIAELKQSPWYKDFSGRFFRKEAVEAIEDLCIKKEPTVDAVEVVRCKDCKHWHITSDGFGECNVMDKQFLGKEYCSFGEKKNND